VTDVTEMMYVKYQQLTTEMMYVRYHIYHTQRRRCFE
jgi:hypothetical protein